MNRRKGDREGKEEIARAVAVEPRIKQTCYVLRQSLKAVLKSVRALEFIRR